MALKVLQNVLANRIEAEKIARQNGGQLPSLLVLDNYKNVQGNTGAFFARQFALCIPAKPKEVEKKAQDEDAPVIQARLPEIILAKGQDFYCKSSNILLPANDVQRLNEMVTNVQRAQLGLPVLLDGVFGAHDLLVLVEPLEVTFEKGKYVLQTPYFNLIENAVTVFGGRGRLDPDTGVALKDEIKVLDSLPDSEKRWNFIAPGIWPITQGIYSYFYYPSQREAQGFRDMNEKHAVLVETIQ